MLNKVKARETLFISQYKNYGKATGEKTHKCPLDGCTKAFTLKFHLINHMKIAKNHKDGMANQKKCDGGSFTYKGEQYYWDDL